MTFAFYNEKELSSDASIEASLLQAMDRMQLPSNEAHNNAVLWPIVFARKSLTSTEAHYIRIAIEVLGILYDLEKFHCYCFAYEVSVIIDHKLL